MSAQPINTDDSVSDSKPLLVQIACNVCHAKYSVGVNQIAGRAVKMRCKKCSAVIVMRGDLPAAPAAPESSQPSVESPFAPEPASTSTSGAPANVTGARNESSVLFTLDKLRGITQTNDIARVAAASVDQLVLASGANSGLIDMGALARGEQKQPIISRVAVTQTSRERMSSTRIFALAFGGSVLLAGSIAAACFYFATRPAQVDATATILEPAQLLPAASVHPIGALDTSAPAVAEAAAPVLPTAAAAPAPVLTAAVTASVEEAAPSHGRARHGRRGRHAVPAARAAHSDHSLDSLIAGTLSGGSGRASAPARAAAPAARASGLPEMPSADAVRAAMGGVRNAARSCGGSQHGTASALVGVTGASGRVSSVSVVGASTAARACLERAVRGAHFPRFQRASFSFRYPIAF